MIEAAIRAIEADDEGAKPPVSGIPAGEQDKDKSEQDVPEDAAQEDPGVVLVDENNGAPAKIPKRKLKEEAVSMAHLISHRFKNPYCQACVHGKMSHLYTKKGAFQRELKEWGDVVTLDFVFPEDQMDDDFVMKMLTVTLISSVPILWTRGPKSMLGTPSNSSIGRSSCCMATTPKSLRRLLRRWKSHSTTLFLTANKPMPLLRGPTSTLRTK